MKENVLILFFCFLFISIGLPAQTDGYAGTWRMEYLPDTGETPINIELQIASSERYILYPAHIKLQCDDFIADYQLLLVRKSTRELGISRNKYPQSEKPFGLGDWTILLNGIFDLSKDLKGVHLLTAMRMESKQNVVSPPDTINVNTPGRSTAKRLRDFLKDGEIRLKKINDTPWDNENRDSILNPGLSPVYFGLLDTIHVQDRDGIISLTGNKKSNNDVVSVKLNGRAIIEQFTLNKKKHEEEILLDTGLNIITFFADNFGNALPNKGKLNLAFAHNKFSLDFANKADSAATFIATRIYCDPDKAKETYFQNMPDPGEERALESNEKLIGDIIASSRQITLAVWDDATEDHDSISISIDESWLVQGYPVKKNPQFIPVTLKPGPNTITFIADNLGSIPPNTSVLEIIDGKKRKSFHMETSPGEKNLVRIFYLIK